MKRAAGSESWESRQTLRNLRRLALPFGAIVLCASLLTRVGSVAALAQEDQAKDPRRSDRQAILKVLDDQDRAWNGGDIDSFMIGYWNSPELTFASGGEITRGWKETLERYHKRYPDRQAMGRVSFTETAVKFLGPDAALVLGRWRLEREKPVGGVFSLVFRRIEGQWLIVHDHTSSSEP
ncbi:MAG: DUF4440 domain-containing protein [Phycisphaerales bacterium]|nr:DUF4440 domain-containing protein [Phycisphaerales bacterium]